MVPASRGGGWVRWLASGRAAAAAGGRRRRRRHSGGAGSGRGGRGGAGRAALLSGRPPHCRAAHRKRVALPRVRAQVLRHCCARRSGGRHVRLVHEPGHGHVARLHEVDEAAKRPAGGEDGAEVVEGEHEEQGPGRPLRELAEGPSHDAAHGDEVPLGEGPGHAALVEDGDDPHDCKVPHQHRHRRVGHGHAVGCERGEQHETAGVAQQHGHGKHDVAGEQPGQAEVEAQRHDKGRRHDNPHDHQRVQKPLPEQRPFVLARRGRRILVDDEIRGQP
mmetsp:Transcript_526/g.2050  ORF Transcript_526/g.2050 Transcript_526/m.2050 type:complete len:276 (+) Transcript_526:555-1382(+)